MSRPFWQRASEVEGCQHSVSRFDHDRAMETYQNHKNRMKLREYTRNRLMDTEMTITKTDNSTSQPNWVDPLCDGNSSTIPRREVCCKDWDINIDTLDDWSIIAGLHRYKVKVKPFAYCPYCGRERIK